MADIRAHIEADIASLREDMVKCRKLAEERKAHGDLAIANKLVEFVADLEVRVARLQAVATLKQNGNGSDA